MKQAIRDVAARISLLDRLLVQTKTAREALLGHYYSPVPNRRDIARFQGPDGATLLGIDLNAPAHELLLQHFEGFYRQSPFQPPVAANIRYSTEQKWFGPADAHYLYGFLRTFKPKRIIEVGSGFSSAVMLDTVDQFFATKPTITFIEPNPQRLHGILRAQDTDRVRLLMTAAQDVPLETYAALEDNDLLFIDSSHVLKRGSDVQFLLFDVLPLLAIGVHVHFHDIHYPFEYPDAWLKSGRYWNEAYALRAFLTFNSSWKITFFADYAAHSFREYVAEKMPLCLRDPSSLYLQRVAPYAQSL